MSSNDIALGSLGVAAIALIVAVLGLVLQYLDFFERRREREPPVILDAFQEREERPFMTYWTIRVRAYKHIERCRVTLDALTIQTVVSRNDVRSEIPLTKGGGANFRIPAETMISVRS